MTLTETLQVTIETYLEGAMNCARKIREKEMEAADLKTLEEKEEVDELTILLEGQYVADDCLC